MIVISVSNRDTVGSSSAQITSVAERPVLRQALKSRSAVIIGNSRINSLPCFYIIPEISDLSVCDGVLAATKPYGKAEAMTARTGAITRPRRPVSHAII